MQFARWSVCSLLVVQAACHPARQPDRVAGERAPLSAACDVLDDTRCMLPWPSSTYTVADKSTPTGIRLALQPKSLPVTDDPSSMNRGDGFSVATPLAVGFPRPVDKRLHEQKATTAIRLLVAQPGAADHGASVPLRLLVTNDSLSTQSMILAYPMRPLSYNTDYVAVALDEVTADDGSAFPATPTVKVALGLAEPATNADAALFAYHAPTRALLTEAGIDFKRVLRVWDFTTRSAEGVKSQLDTMRTAALAAVTAGTIDVMVESATVFTDGSAIDIRGHIGGLPDFLTDTGLSLDAAGLPKSVGVHAQPFRVAVPTGTGPYHVVIYGHGTGGTVYETTFDTEIIAAGAAKLNLEFAGWTDLAIFNTLIGFQNLFSGTDRSTSRLLQSLSDAAAIEAALSGKLGDALSSGTVAGTVNPAAGRRPEVNTLVYAGGSLGGTMGYVHSQADPTIHYAVLNVPGAAWTHFAPQSNLWSILDGIFASATPSEIDLALGMAMTQGNWDAIDGAAWSALSTRTDSIFLEQESIGDPVLPNIGSDFVAASSHAVQLGTVIVPIVGVNAAASATGTALTQYRVPSTVTDALDIHGFAAKDSPAGVAARQQISAFITSVWAGAPQIVVPPGCPNGNCDFASP